jgi:uncharacterized membrane protein
MNYIRYAFIALVGWGFWAIGSKIMTRYFNPASTSFWISLWAIVFLTVYIVIRKDFEINTHVLIGIPIGAVSLIAILGFYTALKHGPTSVVLPLTNLYVIFPVLYGFIFLKESITVQRIIGIVFAIAASILLSL